LYLPLSLFSSVISHPNAFSYVYASFQIIDLASICILHLYANCVKGFSTISAHNCITINVIETLREYLASEIHDEVLHLREEKTVGDHTKTSLPGKTCFVWSPIKLFRHILLALCLAHHLLIELSDTGLLQFVHESDIGHGPF